MFWNVIHNSSYLLENFSFHWKYVQYIKNVKIYCCKDMCEKYEPKG